MIDLKFIIAAAALLLGLLLVFEVLSKHIPRLIAKTLLSALFVATAALQPMANERYFPLMLTGLGFCLVGDILFALKGPKVFLAGFVAYLLGHLAIVTAMVTIARVTWLTTPAIAIHGIIAAGMLRWLRPHVGKMINLVLYSIIVHTAMVIAAWSVMGLEDLSLTARQAILGGALFCYLSNFFVARQRFVKHQHVNSLIGLPTYYAGQFLFAFSVGLL